MELTQVTATGNRVWSADKLEGFDALMQMRPGSRHVFSYREAWGLEDNPLLLEYKWNVALSDAGSVDLQGCRYAHVRVAGTMELSRMDGSVSTYDTAYFYLPELRLKLRGDSMKHGEIVAVRKRQASDGTAWPFSANALDALTYLER